MQRTSSFEVRSVTVKRMHGGKSTALPTRKKIIAI
jgi:hypothetical protein